MPKISPVFKPYAEQWLMNLKKIQDPSQAIGTVRADATLIGNQASEVMAAVGFCENVTFARYAVLEGLDFDSLQTSVRGHWDRRGQGDFSAIEPSFRDFVVETRITSTDSVDKIKRVALTVHRRCPMHSTIAKVGKVVDRLFVNGSEVAL